MPQLFISFGRPQWLARWSRSTQLSRDGSECRLLVRNRWCYGWSRTWRLDEGECRRGNKTWRSQSGATHQPRPCGSQVLVHPGPLEVGQDEFGELDLFLWSWRRCTSHQGGFFTSEGDHYWKCCLDFDLRRPRKIQWGASGINPACPRGSSDSAAAARLADDHKQQWQSGNRSNASANSLSVCLHLFACVVTIPT